MKPSILEYIGSVNGGILALISIVYNNKYYEATFYYTDKDILLTASKQLEDDLGHTITEDKNYVLLLKDILKKIVPYHELINSIDPIDFTNWA